MYKMAIVVRNDLGLSRGKIAAQVAHAAVSCALDSRKHRKKTLDRWLRGGQKKVVLKARDLPHLRALERDANFYDIVNCKIRDQGRTEVEPGTVTCLGLGPAEEERLDRITGDLKLL